MNIASHNQQRVQVDATEAAWDELSRLGKEYAARPDPVAGWHGGNPMSAVAYTAPVFDATKSSSSSATRGSRRW